MKMRCCVPFCRTTAEVISESEITFHEFPREVHLRAAWLRALGKHDTPLPDPAVVCSQHFLNDDIYETASGSRRIRTGAVPSAVLVCMMCLDTRSELVLFSKYKLEEAYEYLVGYPLCGEGKLKQTLCVQCARRLADFSAFRDESLRARGLLTELLDRHEVITIRHVKSISRAQYRPQSDVVIAHSSGRTTPADGRTELDATATGATVRAVAVKRELEDSEDADTVQFDFDTRLCEPESSEHCTPASVAPSAPTAREEDDDPHGDEEHPTDTNDDWDIASFLNNRILVEDSRKSQDTVPKELLAKTSASTNTRTTRPNDLFESKQNSPDMFGKQLGGSTDQIHYICDVCQKIFQRKCALVIHMRTHMRTHTGEKPFACQLCDYKCAKNVHLVKHMRTHTGEKPFACQLCDYKCARNQHLVRHMRTHTGEKPFACRLCDYKCAQNVQLVRHMRTHTGEKPFACKLCKYKCTEKSKLVLHMRTHTGEKPFACKFCKYKCAVNSSLVKHMRTHTGEKPFACQLCEYKCAVNSSLVQHMRTHTGEKPFACKLCKYKCTEKSKLVLHMRTHTGEKPFACKFCKYKCAVNSSLVKHMRTHTGKL